MNEAPLAKLDIASVYGTEGQEFESLTVHQRGIIRIISSLQVIGSDYFFIQENADAIDAKRSNRYSVVSFLTDFLFI